ncbi:ATP-binding cassette domain-containing protein [Paracoccus sp. Z330]|uniref:ATP-binding cassette domain-containing protein n=1 Tax=Paracoccus onchidii TaxID=3017813 RepID=A0ABT4ZGR9_9RHOB|nr:ATP-binding cassette domain-containing protein [Paracoccus onchidii]MDB6178506.1 ATP-binding cassette domain-containing protein [Paracoccus onchidii]
MTSPALRYLTRICAPQRRRLKLGSGLAVLAEALWLPQAAVLAMVLGGMASGQDPDLWMSAGAIAILGVARSGLIFLASRQFEQGADAVLAATRAQILARAQQYAPGPEVPSSAQTAVLMVEKTSLIRAHLLRWPAARARVAVIPVLILAVIFPVSWPVALILMISGPLIPVFMALIGMAAKDASARQMEEISGLNSLLVDRLGALIDIRLLRADKQMKNDFQIRADRLRQQTMQVLRVAFLSSAVLELFAALGVAMTAVYVGFTLLGELRFGSWGRVLTASEGIWLLLLAPVFFQPLRDMAAAWHDRVAAQAAADELLMDEERSLTRIPGQGADADRMAGAISVRGLRLRGISYPDLDIAPGEMLAITGPSGSGKTTFLMALAGILPSDGALKVGDVIVDDKTADGWRQSVALITQHVHFLDLPLRENLTLAPSIDDDRLAQALTLADADEIVNQLPQGLDTVLGERGGGVSGGEARRLIVARTAYWNRPYVMADEPTADLDDMTAQRVIRGLLDLNAQGAGLIVATHDPRLIRVIERRIDLAA